MGRVPVDKISDQVNVSRSIAKTSLKALKPFQPPKMYSLLPMMLAEWAARGDGREPSSSIFWQNIGVSCLSWCVCAVCCFVFFCVYM